MENPTKWLTELCTQNTQSPLLNDLAPGVRGVDKVPQVVIGNDDPVCFFCEVEQEPYVESERERQRERD